MIASVFAIDPGNTASAYTLTGLTDHRPLEVAKTSSSDVLQRLRELANLDQIGVVAIEMVASYGMAVGREVFETCVWIGRYQQTALDLGLPVQITYRRDVKLHHCHSAKAKDANVTQALIDRFASGQPNRGKGTKTAPGWFHGFAADIWQAYALAVYTADQQNGPTS